MARASISAYSATQTSNTLITDDSTDISIAEGFAAANINNAIRTMMTHLADAYAGDAAYDSVTDTITAGTTQTCLLYTSDAADEKRGVDLAQYLGYDKRGVRKCGRRQPDSIRRGTFVYRHLGDCLVHGAQ